MDEATAHEAAPPGVRMRLSAPRPAILDGTWAPPPVQRTS